MENKIAEEYKDTVRNENEQKTLRHEHSKKQIEIIIES